MATEVPDNKTQHYARHNCPSKISSGRYYLRHQVYLRPFNLLEWNYLTLEKAFYNPDLKTVSTHYFRFFKPNAYWPRLQPPTLF